MRKFLPIIGFALLLSACSSVQTTYDLEIDLEDASRRSDAIFGAKNVIERRLQSMGEDILNLDVNRDGERITIDLEVKSQAALDTLRDQLTEPFDLQIMLEAPEAEADAVVEGHGGFALIDFDGSYIEWLTATEQPDGLGRITVEFTEEGRQKMGEIFRDNVGEHIGLFVRRQLVSKLLVSSTELKDDIVISDIPSAELAQIFADDVNVGLHVTFIPFP